MKILLLFTTILVSVWLCAGTTRSIRATDPLLRQRRAISESTRFHNEYDQSNQLVHRTKNSLNASPGNCVPGTRWKNDCNTCWCSESGMQACTYMACLHFDHNALANGHHRQPIRNSISDQGDKPGRVRRSEEQGNECVPGTTWKNDCNTCWCGDSGFAACTLMGCLHLDSNNILTNSHRVRRSEDTFEEKCTPGTTWKDDCNTCWCGDNGIAACTLMGCLHFDSNNRLVNNRQKRSYVDTASPAASTRATRLQNSSPSENGKKCKRGDTWMKSCNRCRCIGGGHAACTRMMCVEKE